MQKQFSIFQHQRLLFGLLLWLSSSVLFASELSAARKAINEMDYTSATTRLVKYLEQHPDDIPALQLLAKTYAWDNQFGPAVTIYDKLLSIKPDEIEYLYGKAQALAWLGKIHEAIPILEKAWLLQHDNPEILRSLLLTLNQSKLAKHKQRAKELGEVARKEFPNQHWELIVD